ncbi:MAG TPA: hypothetical protein VFC34_06090 [Puia sp.]|nr:hypothetical protein [Puia sp.]
MKISKWIFLMASVIILGMLSCKKGDVGPAGPAGPAGAAGAPGPDSILTSSWIPVSMTDTSINSNPYFIQEIPAQAITQRILDNGIVLGYLQYLDANNGTNIFNASEALNLTYSVGNVELLSGTDWTGVFDFRYVIVPGTLTVGNSIVSGPAKGLTKAELQKMNYMDVQKLLGNNTVNQY